MFSNNIWWPPCSTSEDQLGVADPPLKTQNLKELVCAAYDTLHNKSLNIDKKKKTPKTD